MVMSVTPTVCVTLAFGLGNIGLTLTGGCWADTHGAAHATAKRMAKLKNENRLSEIILVSLDRRVSRALSNVGEVDGKRSEQSVRPCFRLLALGGVHCVPCGYGF